jgi:hypothetical protein
MNIFTPEYAALAVLLLAAAVWHLTKKRKTREGSHEGRMDKGKGDGHHS